MDLDKEMLMDQVRKFPYVWNAKAIECKNWLGKYFQLHNKMNDLKLSVIIFEPFTH